MVIKTAKQAYQYAYDNGISFPDDWYITKNFKWNEVFANEISTDGFPMLEVFDNAAELATYMQSIRNDFNKPVHIHCWVRQIPHNKRAGSTAKLSAHINGRAVDFHVEGVSEKEVRKRIIARGYPVRIEADTVGWVHIDRTNYTAWRPGVFYV